MHYISRRDFINGSAIALGATAVAPYIEAAASDSDYYPPALTGLRGSHPGANTHAHNLAWQRAAHPTLEEVDKIHGSALGVAWFDHVKHLAKRNGESRCVAASAARPPRN